MKKKAVIIVFAAVLLSACGKTKDFQFKKVVSWRINNLGLKSSGADAELLFYNPNRFTVQFRHLDADVALEGKDFGHCMSDTSLQIGPEQNFILPVRIDFKPSATLMAGLQFLGKDSVNVHFKGVTRVGRSGIFINYKFDTETKIATNF